MCVAALIVVLFYGNYEVLRRHLMPTIIFLNTYLCLYSFISVCTLSNCSHMNQASTVGSVSPSVYYFLMYALILHIQVNFSVIMWLFLAVSTASTQFLDIQYVSVAFQLNDCLMQIACRVGEHVLVVQAGAHHIITSI